MGNFGGCRMLADTPEKMLRFMDRSNVRPTLFYGHAVLFEGAHGVAADLEIARRYPSRFKLYYPVASPILHTYADLEALDRCPEYIGFKFLADYYQVPLSDPRHDFIWQYADQRRLPVLCHTAGDSVYDGPGEAERILSRWHNLPFIAGHSFFGAWEKAVTLGRKYANLYLELTALMPFPGHVERFVGADWRIASFLGSTRPGFHMMPTSARCSARTFRTKHGQRYFTRTRAVS